VTASTVRRRALDLGDRYCAGCGELLVRKDREDATDWRKRRHCRAECYWSGLRKPASEVPVGPVDWSEAECRGQDDVAFWTDTGRDTEEEERLRELASWYCAPCPIRDACKARGNEIKFGLYGGVLWRVVGGRRKPLDLLAAEPIKAAS
jgi:hypothetical protein